MSKLFENLVLPFESKKPVVVENTTPYVQLVSGTLQGGEEIKPGTLHGGEEIKPGTLHSIFSTSFGLAGVNSKSVFTC